MMHDDMMQGMGWMMGGMALLLLLVIVFLITGIFYFVRNTPTRGKVGRDVSTENERGEDGTDRGH